MTKVATAEFPLWDSVARIGTGRHLTSIDCDTWTADSLGTVMRHRCDTYDWGGDYDWETLARFSKRDMENHLPQNAISTIRKFGETRLPSAMLVRGLGSFDPPGPTPVSGITEDAHFAAIDAYILGLYALIGAQPVSYVFENGGRLVRNVVANPDHIASESSWGAEVDLQWHQDNNFQPFEFDKISLGGLPAMPRYLAFICIRNAERVPTKLLALDAVLERLRPATLHGLANEPFRISPPASVSAHFNALLHEQPGPVLVRQGQHFCGRIDLSGGVMPLTEAGRLCLDGFTKALQAASSCAVEVCLDPGDCLVFDNYRVLHRREAFRPRPPAESRWLRRIYGSTIPTRDPQHGEAT